MSINTMKPKKRKMATEDLIFTIFNTTIMVLFTIVTLYPILNTLAISFNEGSDAVRGGIHLLPRVFSLKSYKTVIKTEGIITGAKITILRTVIGTLSSLIANALLSFILSRKRFLFKSGLSLFWIITMYANGGLIPTMVLFRSLNLIGTFWVYVIPGMVSAFNVMVMRTYMAGIPDSLEESAQLEGAGYMTVFLKIISPLCKPVYATIALFVAVYHWNSWFDAMLYNRTNTKYTTLQYELQKLLASVTAQGQGGGGGAASQTDATVATVIPITIRSAATILTMAPIIALYPFLQRYFVTGLTIGGVKE